MKKILGIVTLVGIGLVLHSEAHAGRKVIWQLKEDVPAQSLPWSCGVHAGCTMMRSQGLEVSLDDLMKNCPKYNVFGFEIGPDPKKLAAYMSSVCNNKICYEAVQMPADTKEEVAIEQLKKSLSEGPVIILTKSGVQAFPFVGSVVQLHNLFVYGFDEDRNEFYVYDTDKTKKILTTQDIVNSWFWDTEDKGKPEFNLVVGGILKSFETRPKMFIRAQPKATNSSAETDEDEMLRLAIEMSLKA